MSLAINIEKTDMPIDYELAESHLAAQDLLAMVAGLPVGYRTVFNLYAIEGYAHQEIAEMLGISENTSKSQLSRARTFLQNKLSTMSKMDHQHGNL